jgi:KipI family sensor histidine kinase inhibitor
VRTVAAGDGALLISLDTEVSPRVQRRVSSLYRFLKRDPLESVTNLHPAYGTVLVEFRPLETTHDEVESWVRSWTGAEDDAAEPRRIEAPVCYGGECGPDLDDVAALHGMTTARVVELHCSAEYLVYFLGFSPGFPYLGGLAEELATPRLATPRTHVPAGSVAIGGRLTGIYPTASPGGWRIIGRTPLRLFDAARPSPALLAPGDVVRFRPVSASEYERLL